MSLYMGKRGGNAVMPRTIANMAKFLEGYKLFSEGETHRNIHEKLKEPVTNGHWWEKTKPPSMRSVGNWITRYKRISPEDQAESQPVQWRELEDAGFSWEAGKALRIYRQVTGRNPSRRALKWMYRLSLVGGWEKDDAELVETAGYYERSELMELFDLDRIPMSWIDRRWL